MAMADGATLGAQAATHSAKAATKAATKTATKTATKARSAAGAPHAATASKAGAGSSRREVRAVGAAPSETAKTAADGAATDVAASVAATAPVALRDAPDGQPLATVSPRMTLQTIARERGWVRVRAEGWVKEGEVAPVDSSRSVLSAADLRADPQAARGKHVRWDVQVLAMATADPLRKGLNPDEPYLLVRGPGPESALLYVAVPPAMISDARQLASLAPVPATLDATVRVGRSEPVGVPILDAQSLTRR